MNSCRISLPLAFSWISFRPQPSQTDSNVSRAAPLYQVPSVSCQAREASAVRNPYVVKNGHPQLEQFIESS